MKCCEQRDISFSVRQISIAHPLCAKLQIPTDIITEKLLYFNSNTYFHLKIDQIP